MNLLNLVPDFISFLLSLPCSLKLTKLVESWLVNTWPSKLAIWGKKQNKTQVLIRSISGFCSINISAMVNVKLPVVNSCLSNLLSVSQSALVRLFKTAPAYHSSF